jgi:hypothetical protein
MAPIGLSSNDVSSSLLYSTVGSLSVVESQAVQNCQISPPSVFLRKLINVQKFLFAITKTTWS